ncbi:ribbon-helix-helix domain-containing protein [Erythrobacter sp. AP23]|jgi:predicted DNA-binding ribbon-helix-helix protein|uniref:ribbon-helix-helix domain-containing protein n=2 Tax=Sphingomonadales TaxID=204457 RepID=UPI000A48DE57
MHMPPYHPPKKYSVRIDGHRTSISLEPLFWEKLCTAATVRGQSINALVAEIDAERIRAETPPGLAGAIRIWLVTHEKSGWIAPAAHPDSQTV